MAEISTSVHIDLRERGIDERLAAELRARFATFAEDWDAPEMEIYDRWETGDTDSSSSRRGSRMITVQPAEVDEVQAIKKVLSETWIDTYGPFLPAEVIKKVTELWHSPETLAAEIENARVFFHVAKNEQGAIVGLLTAGRPSDDIVNIGRLYVLPGYQRQGIGGKLLEACAAAFPEAQRLRLEVEAQNEKGMAFYRKQGFEEVSRKEEKIEETTLEVVEMERQLHRSP